MLQSSKVIGQMFAVGVLLLTGIDVLQAQWRGQNRDGVYSEENLMKSWPEGGPQMLWSQNDLGAGWSSSNVTNDGVFVTGTKDAMDHLSKISLDGKLLWQIPVAKAWNGDFPLARCTPAIENGKAYIISGQGEVLRVDLATQKIDWRRDVHREFDGLYGIWGIAECPLVVGDKIFFTACGPQTTMVALNKNTGEIIWKSKSLNETPAYASPILVEYAGKQIIVNVTSQYVLGVNAADGAILWNYDYGALKAPNIEPAATNINPITPLYYKGQIYVTSGYNHVGAMLKLSEDGSSVDLAWMDATLDCHHGGVVRVGNYIYGSNWLDNRQGNWCCISWDTGKTIYEKEWIGKGSVIYADGLLYCYAEKRGYFGIAAATPKDFDILSSFQIEAGDGQHWSHPVINKGILYVRHGDVLMAYNIRQGS